MSAVSGCTSRIGVMSFDDTYNRLLFAAYNNLVVQESDQSLKYIPAPSPITTICVTSAVYVVGCEKGECFLLAKATLEKIHSVKLDSPIFYSASIGEYLVFGCISGAIHTFKDTMFEQILQIKAPKRLTSLGLTVYKNTTLLLVATSDLQLTIYDYQTSALIITLTNHHTNWINTISSCLQTNRFLTCGQDRVVRVWSISEHRESTSIVEELICNTKKVFISGIPVTIEPQAILLGHEDSVLAGKFLDDTHILTSSADRTVMKWKEGEVWQSILQVGDVAGIGTAGNGDLYDVTQLSDKSILAHNTNGTIVKWIGPDYRLPSVHLSGHTLPVQDISWSPSGAYLLSCSLDRTTRAWIVRRDELQEIARPQIHGYELKSICSLSDAVFVSGGDEKVLRMFQVPLLFADRLEHLSGFSIARDQVSRAGSVVQPALGLSNKPTDVVQADDHMQTHAIPGEHELASNTLFPEIDKLYGHGDEMQCIACSSAGHIASAARANLAGDSSIRIWNAQSRSTVHCIRPHSLTVVRLAFSPDGLHLLSVSRDRKFAVTEVATGLSVWESVEHDRIIWDCCWIDSAMFVTGSRDRKVKVWGLPGKTLWKEFKFEEAVTAVCQHLDYLYVGLETGHVFKLYLVSSAIVQVAKLNGRINRLMGHPTKPYIAIACDDHSLALLCTQ